VISLGGGWSFASMPLLTVPFKVSGDSYNRVTGHFVSAQKPQISEGNHDGLVRCSSVKVTENNGRIP
jgi:hypothetical protein